MDLAIVYMSQTGHTRAMAEAIAEGGSGALFDVQTLDEAAWAQIDGASGIVMGAPTYMGGLPSAFVHFIETASARWDTGQWRDKLAGGFTTAMHPAGDKLNTLTTLSIFAAQMGMIWIGNAETRAPITEGNEGINQDGSWLGVTASHAGPEGGLSLDGMTPGDLETARRYGIRMRAALTRWG